MNHEDYMQVALGLAIKGQGSVRPVRDRSRLWRDRKSATPTSVLVSDKTKENAFDRESCISNGVSPNPMVGAVIVRNNRIIGQGYHQYFGGPHAEINAINSVKNPEHIKGSTLYLTLEPCSHFGKTPPCAEAICYSGIKQVVMAVRDPNPLVRGRGVRLLKQHKINVIEGVLESKARAINKPFFKAQEKGLPYVIAKWAMSEDGKLVTKPGQPRWITSKKSREYAKSIRGQCQGVMVGIGTALKDDPGLLSKSPAEGGINSEHRAKSGTGDYTLGVYTERSECAPRSTLVRVILDSRARLPLNSKLVKTIGQGPVWVMVSSSAPEKKVRLLEQKGVRVFRVPSHKGHLDFMAVMRILVKSGINKLMIEGGPEVLASAFYYKVVDEVYCFIAPKALGNKNPGAGIFRVAQALQLDDITVKYLKPDALVHGYV